MAKVRITDLTATSSLASTDVFPVVNVTDNTTYKITAQNLANNLSIVPSSSRAISSSNSLTSSYALNGGVTSIIAGSSITVDTSTGNVTVSYAGGGGAFPFTGSAQLTASNGQTSAVLGVTGSISIFSGSSLLGTASWAYNVVGGSSTFPYTGSATISGSLIIIQSGSAGIEVTGSVISTAGFTGSLLGTASYVTGALFTSTNPALSASYALSSSFVTGSIFKSSNLALSSSYAISSSYTLSSSFSSTSSYVNALNQNVSITGSLVVSGSNGAGIFSQGATLIDYIDGISSTGSYVVWRAPFSCSIVAAYGYREGGGPSRVNVARSGSSGYGLVTASDANLTLAGTWIPFVTLENTTFNSGDTLRLIMTGSASNNQLAVQVDFIRKF